MDNTKHSNMAQDTLQNLIDGARAETAELNAPGLIRGPIMLRQGNQPISPTIAQRIQHECKFEGQESRLRAAGFQVAVDKFIEVMRRGKWLDYSQINFCRVGDRLYLVNGYHRIYAVIGYGHQLLFNVVIYECNSEDDVAAIYAEFDRPGFQNIRSDRQALDALGFAQKLELSRQVATALYKTIPLIRNGMRSVRLNDTQTKIEMSVLEVHVEACYAWARQTKCLDDILRGCSTEIKKKLLNPQCMAVILQTLKYQEFRASEFWSRVAKNDGLRAGSPEHTLLTTLLKSKQRGGDDNNFILPALAWNAFYEGRKLETLKPNAVIGLRIAGTPIAHRNVP